MSFDGRPHRDEATTTCVLGIDLGSTNIKVALVAVDGERQARELLVRSLPTPDDAVELVLAAETLIRHVLGLTRIAPAAVGVASMAETGVALDAQRRPLTPLIRWNTMRDRLDADDLAEQFGAASLFAATGVPIGPKAPLMMWSRLRRTKPELWRRMAWWSGVADLVVLSLTGNLVTDHTLAGRTMAYRLPPAGAPLPAGFDPELLAAVGLQAQQLPQVALPGERAGVVTGEAAGRTGLTPGIPVIVAGHDHAVGSWAAGMRQPAQSADSVGTTEAMLHIVGGAAVDRAAVAASGMSLGRTVTGQQECLIAGSATGGALIAWWFSRLAVSDPAAVLEAAGDRVGHPTGLLVLPYLFGRQSPRPDPDARLRILDRDGRQIEPDSRDPVELTCALLEGLAMQLRWMDSEQRALAAGSVPERPITTLGGHSIPGWLRMKAAVMPSRLRAATASEPVASGAALLAAVRAGIVPESVALPSRPVHAEPDHARLYDAGYARFIAAASASSAESDRTPIGVRNPARGDT